jgi:hypothetical protein
MRQPLGDKPEGIIPGNTLPPVPRATNRIEQAIRIMEASEIVVSPPAEGPSGDSMLRVSPVTGDPPVLHSGNDATGVGAVPDAGGALLFRHRLFRSLLARRNLGQRESIIASYL